MADRTDEIDQDLKKDGVPTTVDTRKACEILGVERRTLYRYTRDGRIKGSRVGKANRYTRAELARFLSSSEY